LPFQIHPIEMAELGLWIRRQERVGIKLLCIS
jgi:hypothetical protein